MEFDSIIYIIITIVVLVISGLGNRRKRQQAQQARQAAQSESDRDTEAERQASVREMAEQARASQSRTTTYDDAYEDDYLEPVEPQPAGPEPQKPRSSRPNLFGIPLNDLSEAFGQTPTTGQGNPFDRFEQFITGKTPVTPPAPTGPVSMEGESMEETIDEEEEILEKIRRDREGYSDKIEESGIPDVAEFNYNETGIAQLPPLFENADEIKKAIIYSEILKRKYT